MPKLVARFLSDESGATAIEYGLIAGLIFLVIVSAVGLLGESLAESYNDVAGAFS